MFDTRTIIAAVLAGIAGTIANSIAITAAMGAPLMPLIFSFGREAVAILVALLLIPIFARLSGASAWICSFLTLTILPSVLAKLVFDAGSSWSAVLMLNAVYAIVAILVYVLVVRNASKI